MRSHFVLPIRSRCGIAWASFRRLPTTKHAGANKHRTTFVGCARTHSVFLFWIWPDTALFFHQNLAYATGYHFSQHWYRFTSFGYVQMQALCCILLLAVSLVKKRSSAAGHLMGLRTNWCVGLALVALLDDYCSLRIQGMLIASAMLASLCLLLTQMIEARRVNLQSATLAVMATLALAMILYTALMGFGGSGRHFAAFGKQVAQQSNLNGLVLIDNPAWLALRERLPKDRLIHLIPILYDASFLNRSTILDDPRNSTSVSTIIVRTRCSQITIRNSSGGRVSPTAGCRGSNRGRR